NMSTPCHAMTAANTPRIENNRVKLSTFARQQLGQIKSQHVFDSCDDHEFVLAKAPCVVPRPPIVRMSLGDLAHATTNTLLLSLWWQIDCAQSYCDSGLLPPGAPPEGWAIIDRIGNCETEAPSGTRR